MMYLALNDEQRLLVQTIRSFVQKELPSSKVRELVATQDAFDEDLWRKMAEQGWMSVTVPSMPAVSSPNPKYMRSWPTAMV